METRYKVLRYFAYSLEILIFYILQGTPYVVPEIFGSRPCLLIPIALTIAVFENEVAAMVFGAVCGLLTDFGYDNSVGYFAIFLAIICFFIGFFCENYIVINLLTTIIISLIVTVIVIGLHFVFFYIFVGYKEAGVYFVNHYISRILYTFAFCIPFYYLNRMLYNGIYQGNY